MLFKILLLASVLQKADTVVVTNRPCANCTVHLDSVALISDDNGDRIGEIVALGIDSRGRILMSHSRSPGRLSVFSPRGTFERHVGRPGGGPGEFGRISNIAAGYGRIIVYDTRNGRATLYDSSFSNYKSWPAGERPETIVLRPDGSAILAAVVPTPDEIGFTLHRIDSTGRRIRSFALLDVPYREDIRELFVRSITPAADTGQYWVAHRKEYAFARCSFNRDECTTYLRPVSWFPKPDVSVAALRPSATVPPTPSLVSVSEDASGIVWTLSNVPDRNFREAVQRINANEFAVIDFNKYFDSIIEAIDSKTGKVLASARVEERLYRFVAPGVAYALLNESGDTQVKVVRVRMSGKP